MDPQMMQAFPNLDLQEMMFINEALKDATETQRKNFILAYQTRRKDPQTIMICTVIGLILVAGIQRFMLGQIGMGLLYFFTGGLCLVGTIVDIINYKSLTFDYNQKMIVESRIIAYSFWL